MLRRVELLAREERQRIDHITSEHFSLSVVVWVQLFDIEVFEAQVVFIR